MKTARNYPFPSYRRLKWGMPILKKILINGATAKSELRELKDNTTGKKISRKMLWETLNILEKDDFLKKIPSKETCDVYELSLRFRAKELDQLIYLEAMGKDKIFSETLTFQHTVYGLPKFEDMKDKHKKIVLNSINKIDDALSNLKKLDDKSPLNIALLSTYPIKWTKAVEENIELKLDELFKDGLLYKKTGKRIAYGNLVRFQEVILAGMTCRHGNWVNNEVSKVKFVYHKNLKQNFTAVEIKFMLSIISEIVKKNIDFKSCDLEKFIIYKGFNDGGLWYSENKSNFYNIAESTVKSIDTKEFYLLGVVGIHDRIKSCILENPNTPPDLRTYELTKYGLSELISYIESKIYFEKTWKPNEEINEL